MKKQYRGRATSARVVNAVRRVSGPSGTPKGLTFMHLYVLANHPEMYEMVP